MANKKIETINQRHFKIKAHTDIDTGETSLRSLWIEIPDYCHLQCSYCFANTCRNKPHLAKNNLKVEEYLELIDEFAANGGKYLGIPGNGEPFHPANRNLVCQILKRATNKGLSTTVFTTGDAIFWNMLPGITYSECISANPDFTLIDKLITYDIILLIKCNSIMDKEDEKGFTIQDKLVGQAGYTKARKEAMKILIDKYHLNKQERLGIVTSIMPENKEEIIELVKYARKNNLIFDCDTILPRGRGKSFYESPNDTQQCDLCHEKMSHQEYKAIYKALEKESGGNFSICGSYVGVACDRIKHHLYIDIDGNAYPCIGCVDKDKKLCLGNIRNQSIKDIWNTPVRSLLRNDLRTIVYGPCSMCKNFNETCFSCLGRSVNTFEIHNDKIILHTKGCFNHSPTWDEWINRCKGFIINMITDPEIPEDIQNNLVKSVKDLSIEHFWSANCEETGQPYRNSYPDIIKDLSYSNINFKLSSIWDIVPDIKKTKELAYGGASAETFKDNYKNTYETLVRTLLSRLLLTSLKLIYEDCNSTFTPREDFVSCEKGLVQFTNLMFYLPGEGKSRYTYRTISQNSLDPFVMALPENVSIINKKAEEKINQELKLRNREVRLIQRWAETFNKDKKAPILNHIRNLSRDFEDERTDTYELLLTEEIYAKTRTEIDSDIRNSNKSIIAIYPLLELDVIKKKVKLLHDMVFKIIEDDVKWKDVCKDISNKVFIEYADIFVKLKNTYMNFAEHVFYKHGEITQSNKTQIEAAIKKIIAINTIFFPEGSEASWCDGDLKNIINKIEWRDFKAILCRDFYQRESNKEQNRLLKCYNKINKNAQNIVKDRLYNPLIRLIVGLFIDLKPDNDLLGPEFEKAINYFIWLSYFKEYLNVNSYFVHHPPNLSRYYGKFTNVKNYKNGTDSTPCGIIVSSNGRLPAITKDQITNIFNSIMNPLEELIQASYVIKRDYSVTLQNAFRNSGHTMRNRSENIGLYLHHEDYEPSWHKKYWQEVKQGGFSDRALTEEEKDYHLSWLAAKTFPETCMVLELWGFQDLNSFWYGWPENPDKKKRFFDYSGVDGEVKGLFNVCCALATIKKPIELGNETEMCSVYVLPRFDKSLVSVTLKPVLEDPQLNSKCRLNRALLEAIFFEIFRNIAEYGIANKRVEKDRNAGRCIIEAGISVRQTDGENWINIWNYANPPMKDKWNTDGYLSIEGDAGKGIGLISNVLTQLDLGKIEIRRFTTKNGYIYSTAIWLKGLEIIYK